MSLKIKKSVVFLKCLTCLPLSRPFSEKTEIILLKLSLVSRCLWLLQSLTRRKFACEFKGDVTWNNF